MSAFSTLVENADTLENARKTRKNDKIKCRLAKYCSVQFRN